MTATAPLAATVKVRAGAYASPATTGLAPVTYSISADDSAGGYYSRGAYVAAGSGWNVTAYARTNGVVTDEIRRAWFRTLREARAYIASWAADHGHDVTA